MPLNHTVIGASIENFIQLGEGDAHAVDYGAITLANAATRETRVTLSEGVKVPTAYLAKARSLGSEDAAGLFGKVTAGEVLAANTGVDMADWHEKVCGKSRYPILEEAANKVDVSL